MMPAANAPEPLAREPGRLSKAVTRLWMKHATITANERLAARCHLITLEGAALQGVTWQPGQKVQIAMGSAFSTRTYTPIEWNPSTGRACILGYAHGDGPGSTWVRSVAPGDECDVFGPRASLDLRRLHGPLVMVGDETSMGLAYAATHQDRGRIVTCGFEVEDVETARRVTAQLGLQDAALVAKRDDNAHIAAIEAVIIKGLAVDASFVLTGKSATIQSVRQILRQHSIPASRLVTKAYWAPGKTGMD